ncbi:MAG: bifunctional ADP-dependent NAD(P)H-hydrate dehydratase/NAD(P)H-hydrate epimerase, partial [Candidatus Aenigmarchaeota archaeon]|nr:bifunctional ADP-dependent NAD(P)H-hydrate dehydratase/NAD(P)H-hydrate epimerase [Candidatus Aenigmarchaeota archaeon]NIS72893.1 bifunctional ADP-dependent NAD(P)H-hydrate dehydratase/NAD(P)H-hydrate epimerase [Candidatus Aenigmarchaeota archaeon]
RLGKNFVLTPHAYEFYHISGKRPKHDILSRAKLVENFAKKIGSTILLKGAVDIISDGKQTAMNKTGNPYMTTGGTGDVLTGVCGGLLAQGVSQFKAACASAYITGKAGDLAANEKGSGLLATDIIEKIPEVVS